MNAFSSLIFVIFSVSSMYFCCDVTYDRINRLFPFKVQQCLNRLNRASNHNHLDSQQKRGTQRQHSEQGSTASNSNTKSTRKQVQDKTSNEQTEKDQGAGVFRVCYDELMMLMQLFASWTNHHEQEQGIILCHFLIRLISCSIGLLQYSFCLFLLVFYL
jgi:hypothetical protein